MDLSLIIPTIRTQNLPSLYHSIQDSIAPYKWELILIGPYSPPEPLKTHRNVKYIEDWGAPCRAAQRGTTIAEGRLIVQGADDAYYFPGALARCIALYDSVCREEDFVGVRYGENRAERPLTYWECEHHDDLRLPLIRHLSFSPLCLISTKKFREVGGWDTRYYCLNMPTIDLCLRLQLNGSKMFLTPEIVLDCVWEPGTTGTHAPIHEAETQHDIPLFKQSWSGSEPPRLNLDYRAWENTPERWTMRFK